MSPTNSLYLFGIPGESGTSVIITFPLLQARNGLAETDAVFGRKEPPQAAHHKQLLFVSP